MLPQVFHDLSFAVAIEMVCGAKTKGLLTDDEYDFARICVETMNAGAAAPNLPYPFARGRGVHKRKEFGDFVEHVLVPRVKQRRQNALESKEVEPLCFMEIAVEHGLSAHEIADKFVTKRLTPFPCISMPALCCKHDGRAKTLPSTIPLVAGNVGSPTASNV